MLASEALFSLFDFEANFENVLWICVLPPAVPRCLSLFAVSQVG